MLGRRLMRRRGKPRVPFSAPPSPGRQVPFAGPGEVIQALPRVYVVNYCAYGNFDLNRSPFVTRPVTAFAVPAALPFVLRIEAQVQQGVLVWVRYQGHVAAAPAIPARGTAARDIFLPPECQAAVP